MKKKETLLTLERHLLMFSPDTTLALDFKQGLSHMCQMVHENSKAHGFYGTAYRPHKKSVEQIATRIALVHSELSEALEALRKGDNANFAEELADVQIRLLDMCAWLGINLGAEVLKKHDTNIRRPFKHGGKRF